VITVAEASERQRLEGQVQMLEPLRQPQLLEIAPDQPEQLAALLEPGQRFEWVAARQPFQGAPPDSLRRWVQTITALSAEKAEIRLLFSAPLIGPAEALLAWLAGEGKGSPARSLRQRLETCLPLERHWLAEASLTPEAIGALLEGSGWSLNNDCWQESLQIRLSESLLERWFGAASSHGQALRQHISETAISEIRAGFTAALQAQLPQRLAHTLLTAQRGKGAQATIKKAPESRG